MARPKSAKKCAIPSWLSARPDCKEGRFIQVGNSLFLDKRFQSLPQGAQNLYLCMSLESGGRSEFTFPKKTATKYGIPESSCRRYINALIKGGFVEVTLNGKITREENRYKFSMKWKSTKPL